MGDCLLPNEADKSDAFPRDGADQGLRAAVIADRLASGVDPACQRRIRDDTAAPDLGQKVSLADNELAVAQKKDEEIEYLRLKRNWFAAAAEFAAIDIEPMLTKDKFHGHAPIGPELSSDENSNAGIGGAMNRAGPGTNPALADQAV